MYHDIGYNLLKVIFKKALQNFRQNKGLKEKTNHSTDNCLVIY
jgi:hypothetical protein